MSGFEVLEGSSIAFKAPQKRESFPQSFCCLGSHNLAVLLPGLVNTGHFYKQKSNENILSHELLRRDIVSKNKVFL